MTGDISEHLWYEQAFELAAMGMSLVSPDGRWLKINQATCAIVGYSKDELLKMRFQDITHPDDLADDLARTQQLLDGELASLELQKRYIRKDGRQIWVKLNIAAVRDGSGKPEYLITQIQDITQQKEAASALQESQRLLEVTIRGANIGTWDLNLQTGVNKVNETWAKMLGYTPEEVETTHGFFESLVHPDDLPQSQEVMQAHIRGENPFMEQLLRLRGKDGSWRWVLSRGQIIEWSPEGYPLRAVGTHLDLSQQKAAEESLEVTQNRLDFLLKANPATLFAAELELPYKPTFMSDNIYRMFGYTAKEYLSDPQFWFERVHPDDVETVIRQASRLMEQKTLRMQYRFRHADGSYRWVLDESQLMFDQAGHPTEAVGYWVDITDQVQAQEALQASEAAMREAQRAAKLGSWQYNLETDCFDFSEELCWLFGIDQGAYRHRAEVLNLIHPEDMTKVLRGIENTTANESIELEFRLVTPTGLTRHVVSRSKPICSDGKVLRRFGTLQDITDRVQAESAARDKERAEAANRAKSEFLSRMSHELRTPLNSILGFAQLLEFDLSDFAQQQNLKYILTAGRHLLQLINELLDISRIESGQLSISLEPVLLHELLPECVELVQPLATARNIKLEPANPEVFAFTVLADRQRLKQVLFNLLSNAIKYNRPQGTVRLECTCTQTAVRLSISDQGLGISPHKLHRLFIPFDRLGLSDGEGTGLGLALSKRLVEAMHGKLGVKSWENVGSTFWFELPLAPASLTLPSSQIWRQTPMLEIEPYQTVLYIEDNAFNTRLIENIIARQPNIRLQTAAQGNLGLEMAIRHPPDLILLDLHLPDTFGAEILAELRKNERTQHIPVLILSADASPNQIERLLNSGATDYIPKPLDVPYFVESLGKYLGGKSST